ncbi:MAG: hypothetical protein PHO34_05610 [Candidatus Omnitrophica bacterium]|nr:hypothetical protein [Candidatus Omnitrophota bacterium]
MLKKTVFCFLFCCFLLPVLHAESIVLKSGQKIEGEVIERTGDHIKVDFFGVPLTYFFNEIESIDGQPVSAQETAVRQEAASESGAEKKEIPEDDPSKADISGRISMPSYKEGFFLVTANKIVNGQEQLEPVSIASVNSLNEEYHIKVPKGTGNVNLYVMNLTEGKLLPGTEIGYSDVPNTPYRNNPVNVEEENISGIDFNIDLIPGGQIMAAYQGETVKVSGVISMPDYKEGYISISVGKDRFGPPTVTSARIDKPGEYEVEVAKGIGEVYIGAFNLMPDELIPNADSLQGQYTGNPLSIGESDISDVEIVIKAK